MNPWILAGVVAVGLFASGVFSGSETGLYSVSRSRLDLEADDGRRGARLVRRLANRRAAILVTILIHWFRNYRRNCFQRLEVSADDLEQFMTR